MSDARKTYLIGAVVLIFYFVPFESAKIMDAVKEGFLMLSDYAKHHMLFSLIPAFFISGAIGVFFKKGAVIKYLGVKASKIKAYAIASVAGSVLSVCSCTIIPIFGGIYKKGAGLGPGIAFLYAGPAINVLAIILTARILGWELGLARIIGAVVFAVLIGFMMSVIFEKGERKRQENLNIPEEVESREKSTGLTVFFFAVLFGILIFAGWERDDSIKYWNMIYALKWPAVSALIAVLGITLALKFTKDEIGMWLWETRRLIIDMMPLLFAGILLAGFFLGRPGYEGLIPSEWIISLVGSNSAASNAAAAVLGGLMYFCTLIEVPILQGLMGSGMHKGPALALLLAGPSISLPHMLVARKILGTKKTAVYIVFVVILSAIAGMIYGII